MKTFDEYMAVVEATALYPDEHKLMYPILGLTNEAGEVAGKMKKTLRGDRELDKLAVAQELGDVLWYLGATARDLGYSLGEIAAMNGAKLLDRKDRGVLKGDGDNR